MHDCFTVHLVFVSCDIFFSLSDILFRTFACMDFSVHPPPPPPSLFKCSSLKNMVNSFGHLPIFHAHARSRGMAMAWLIFNKYAVLKERSGPISLRHGKYLLTKTIHSQIAEYSTTKLETCAPIKLETCAHRA
jgi:hypothetical protein